MGCYSTIAVTSKDRLDDAIVFTEQSLKELGYKKTGASTGKNTDITRSEGFVYMPNVGVIPYFDEKKNETTIDNYIFADSTGNTVSYSVAYELIESHDKIWFVENTNVVGCATSNPEQYEHLCGEKSTIKQINHIDKIDKVSIYDNDKTWGLVLGLEGGLLIAVCIWALSL